MQKPKWIIFIAFPIFVGLTSASIGNYLPFSGLYPIPEKTPEPVNIISKFTYPLHTPVTITFKGNLGREQVYLTNTGTVIKIDLKFLNTTQVVFGGPLYNKRYIYTETKFYWTNDLKGAAYTTVNGRNGAPLEVAMIYYNEEYGSHYNSLNYRDGIVETLVRINVGSKHNPDFEPFLKAMKTVQKPGPPTEIKLYDAFKWYYNVPQTIGYFVYPGSQFNETSGGTFYCSTTIVFDKSKLQFISEKQFREAFLELQDKNGKQLINQRDQNPQGFRPVARARKIKRIVSNKFYPSVI
ncbi:carbonic anhydrase 2-like isoform X2 [Planococcus citri]|uniref:carbonic anhydrase 2-like isoform X2 n=1 Tax=Planococcus citri TaxID=170843 RepID=UPI0031F94B15